MCPGDWTHNHLVQMEMPALWAGAAHTETKWWRRGLLKQWGACLLKGEAGRLFGWVNATRWCSCLLKCAHTGCVDRSGLYQRTRQYGPLGTNRRVKHSHWLTLRICNGWAKDTVVNRSKWVPSYGGKSTQMYLKHWRAILMAFRSAAAHLE